MMFFEEEIEVLEYFKEEVDNDNYGQIKEEKFSSLIEDEDAVEAAEEEYKNRREESQNKKKIRTTIMAAFLRNGIIERVTQWEFKKLFPLRTLEVNSADILIGNQTDGSIILIVILPLRQRPETGISQSVEMLQDVRTNNTTLSNDIDLDFHNDRIKAAIAIEPARADDTATAIERYEQSSSNYEEFYIWRIAGTEGEKIDLYTNFPNTQGRERFHEGDLGQVLDEGRKIMDSPHVLPDFFYDSHHSLLLEHSIPMLGSIHNSTDIPNTHFSRQELQGYFDETLYGSDSTHKATQLTTRVLTLWEHLGIIKKLSPSNDKIDDQSTSYRFDSRKQNPKSIYDDIAEDYQQKTIEFLLEVEAMEDAIEQFQNDRGIQADLAAFTTDDR